MLLDPLADLLSKIKNAEAVGKKQVIKRNISKLCKDVLKVLKDNNYVEEFEIVNDNRGGIVIVKLNGKINNCGVIKPRFSTKHNQIEEYEERYLPAQAFGLLIISTPKGVMTNIEAKKRKIGGSLIAYIY